MLKAIKCMPFDKSPGPGGFTGRFYATCWHIIKAYLMRALEQFHQEDMRGLAAIIKAMVSLLPKKDGAMDIKDYRPVSFISGLINFLTKYLPPDLWRTCQS